MNDFEQALVCIKAYNIKCDIGVFNLSNESYNELDSVCKNALDYLCREWDYALVIENDKLTDV